MDPRYRSALNRDVLPARAGEFAPLRIGPLEVASPIVLAPMAGVTNAPFRRLCRKFGGGLFVSEMITARALVEGNTKSHKLADFAPDESPRSLQLYGVDPQSMAEATAWLVGEGRVDHIDLNFGCPVRKVTRKGGGAAIPARPALLAKIVRAVVKHAEAVPVTIKFRIGIDERLTTFLDTGRIGEQEGCAAVALHARTAAQLYDGEADWAAIAELKQNVRGIPVLGNGDIWEAFDALRMMRSTGCDGVVVGRGCLGRPWLFRDLAQVFAGHEPQEPPNFGEVRATMLEHAHLLADFFGEAPAMRAFRRHATWYTKGFPGSAQLRGELIRVTSLTGLEEVLEAVDPNLPFPPEAMRVPRGKKAGTQKVALPEGFFDHLEDDSPVDPDAELAISGG
ncbi:MAG: tRNA dihydrouridine synthase DusB [bacterium]|nr:tRNA dihydrouridine synthase DusB [bacterium]